MLKSYKYNDDEDSWRETQLKWSAKPRDTVYGSSKKTIVRPLSQVPSNNRKQTKELPARNCFYLQKANMHISRLSSFWALL